MRNVKIDLKRNWKFWLREREWKWEKWVESQERWDYRYCWNYLWRKERKEPRVVLRLVIEFDMGRALVYVWVRVENQSDRMGHNHQ